MIQKSQSMQGSDKTAGITVELDDGVRIFLSGNRLIDQIHDAEGPGRSA